LEFVGLDVYFSYEGLDLSIHFAPSIIHTSFILIYIVLFFMLAWKAFLKYDVR